MQEFVRNNAW